MIIFRDKNNPKGNLGKNKTNSTNSSPEVLPLKSGDYVKNAKDTGDDTPSEGVLGLTTGRSTQVRGCL